MRVSTQFPIVCHALLIIALFPDKKVTSEMVAESAGCNAVIVRNIFTKLKKAQLLLIKVGRGNTTLAQPTEKISLWDIYTAIETDKIKSMFKMHTNASQSCPIGSNVHGLLLHHLEDGVHAMKQELSKVTLRTIMNELLVQ